MADPKSTNVNGKPMVNIGWTEEELTNMINLIDEFFAEFDPLPNDPALGIRRKLVNRRRRLRKKVTT